jgi:ribosomal protein S18 acetylase RimI-like enzyme
LVKEFLANPMNVLVVAIAVGTVVGMTSGIIYVHPDKPRQLFVNEVGVDDDYQRQGIGARLIQAILELGREEGCTEAWVATESDNVAALGLYESQGGELAPETIRMFTWDFAKRI